MRKVKVMWALWAEWMLRQLMCICLRNNENFRISERLFWSVDFCEFNKTNIVVYGGFSLTAFLSVVKSNCICTLSITIFCSFYFFNSIPKRHLSLGGNWRKSTTVWANWSAEQAVTRKRSVFTPKYNYVTLLLCRFCLLIYFINIMNK